MKSLSHVRPSVIPWTAAHQAPPSMGFSRQEYWSGVPLPSPDPMQLPAFPLPDYYYTENSEIPKKHLELKDLIS